VFRKGAEVFTGEMPCSRRRLRHSQDNHHSTAKEVGRQYGRSARTGTAKPGIAGVNGETCFTLINSILDLTINFFLISPG